MAAPSLRQLLEAYEARLLTIPGLKVTDYAPGSVTTPQAIVTVPPVDNYITSLGGIRPTLTPTIIVLVSATLTRAGQHALADYADPAGPLSIPAAFANEPTLGGVVGGVQIQRFEPLGQEEMNLLGYWGGQFTTRVLT